MKRFLSTILFAGLLLTGISCNGSSDQTTTTPATNTAQSASSERTAPAKVTLVKYSDYQCPACKYYWQFEEQLKADLGDDVEIITKHFPLSMHAYAHVAARSVEAARKQGKYKEMHDKIFEGQEVWSQGNAEAIFISYAEDIGLDLDTFRADMNSADMNRIVMADRREGRDLGVNSTPTFYINGEEMESNPSSYPAFKAYVEQYLD